jgi:hypothetical protein
LDQDKAPILIFKVEPVLDKLKKNPKPLGPTRQPPSLNNSAATAPPAARAAFANRLHRL